MNDFERRKGLGLVSIAERARIAGGTITIETEVSHGTRVHATIPVNGRRNIVLMLALMRR